MLPWSCRISPCEDFNRLIFAALCIKTQNNLHLNSICQGVNFGVNNMILADFLLLVRIQMPVTVLITSCSFSMKCHFTPCLRGTLLAHPSSRSPSKFTRMLTACFQCCPSQSQPFWAVVNPSTALADWGQTSSSWHRRLSLPRPWEAVCGGAELQFQGVLLAISYRPHSIYSLASLGSHPGCSHRASVGSF